LNILGLLYRQVENIQLDKLQSAKVTEMLTKCFVCYFG